MPELIIGFSLIVVIIICVWLYASHKESKSFKEQTFSILNVYGDVISNDKTTLFKINNKTYEIMFFKIAKTHELTINSKYIWEVHMKGRSTLLNQMYFLKSEYPKIIIIYPMETKIKRFINENEMVFIDYKDEFYNMRLVKLNELEILLNDYLK